jgi:hypothetical protein
VKGSDISYGSDPSGLICGFAFGTTAAARHLDSAAALEWLQTPLANTAVLHKRDQSSTANEASACIKQLKSATLVQLGEPSATCVGCFSR